MAKQIANTVQKVNMEILKECRCVKLVLLARIQQRLVLKAMWLAYLARLVPGPFKPTTPVSTALRVSFLVPIVHLNVILVQVENTDLKQA